jgi:hypothetical protein
MHASGAIVLVCSDAHALSRVCNTTCEAWCVYQGQGPPGLQHLELKNEDTRYKTLKEHSISMRPWRVRVLLKRKCELLSKAV